MKVLFIIDTFHRGRHFLLEFPFNPNSKRKTTSTDHTNQSDPNSNKNCNSNWNRVFAEIFSHKNKLANNYIFDILIGNNRYISFPLWLDQNKYLNCKYFKKDMEEGEHSDEEEHQKFEMKKNLIKLKMFNIVIVYEKTNPILTKQNLNMIYHILESFSHYLAFEEYRAVFLGHEIFNIFKTLEEVSKDHDLIEDANLHLGKYFNEIFHKNKENYNSNSNSNSKPDAIKESAKDKGFFLVKTLLKLYEDLKSFQFFKIPINNWYEYKAPSKLLEFTSDIKNYHTLLITKRKQLNEWQMNNYDLNPIIQIFFEVCSPFKNFLEISLEHKIPLDFVKLIAKQIHCMNFGKIIKKFNNNTILTVNPQMKIKIKMDFDILKIYNMNLDDTLNNFTYQKSLNKIFKKHFSQITREKFLNLVEFLASNECLSQCNKYILPKFPMKRKYNHERILLSKAQLTFRKHEKVDLILNDFDAEEHSRLNDKDRHEIVNEEPNGDKNKNNISGLNFKQNIYFEDVISLIKSQSPKDYEIFNNIFFLLTPEFDIDEICFLTGYNDYILEELFKKYKYLFDVIVNVEDE